MPIVGDVLAERYRLEAVLGVGGMASVFRATDLRLERQVAVKVLAATLAADTVFAERFDREARAMASFSHPNVVAVYDVEPGDPTTGREPFYVMEYCQSGSLADRLAATGTIPPAQLVPIVTAVADGLAELHRRGLIHRDVKPANILFADERPKLADFGIAREDRQAGTDALTLPGSTLGTARFLAPELLAGAQPSVASDVYALGVSLFLALTGRYPDPEALVPPSPNSASGGAAAPPMMAVSAAAPSLGTAFDAAVAAALSRDPAHRPSPTKLAADLGASLVGHGVASPNPGAIDAAIDVTAPTQVGTSPLVAPVAGAPLSAAELPATALPAAAAPRPGGAGRSWPAIAVPLVAVLLAILLAGLAVLLLMNLGGLSGGLGSSPSPATSTAPTTPATVIPSNDLQVLAALDRVGAAIDAARGGKDGLSGKDANELEQLAASVRTAVTNGDLAAARASAQTLSDRAQALSGGLDATRRDQLLAAVAAVRSALGG